MTILSASLALFCFIELTHIWKPNSIFSGSQCSGSPELGLFSLGLQLNLWRESAALPLNEFGPCVHSRLCWLDYTKRSGWCYGVWRTKQPLLKVTEFCFHNIPGDAKPTSTIHYKSFESLGWLCAFSRLAEPPESALDLARLKLCKWLMCILGFPGGSEGKESAYNAGDLGSIPGSGRSPGEGNGNPLQYTCLKNPVDGEAW